MLAMELLDATLTGMSKEFSTFSVALSQDARLPFLRLGSPYRPSLLTCNWKGNTSNLYKTTASGALLVVEPPERKDLSPVGVVKKFNIEATSALKVPHDA